MYTIDQGLLYKALGEIVDRIESCGASPELTHAVSLASDLRRAIGNQYNPADPYSLIRVAEEINHISSGPAQVHISGIDFLNDESLRKLSDGIREVINGLQA